MRSLRWSIIETSSMNRLLARVAWCGSTAAMLLLVGMQVFHTPFHHLSGSGCCESSPHADSTSGHCSPDCDCAFSRFRQRAADGRSALATADRPSDSPRRPCDGSHGDCHLCRFLAQGFGNITAALQLTGGDVLENREATAERSAVVLLIASPPARGPPAVA